MDAREAYLRNLFCHRCNRNIRHLEVLGERNSFKPEIWQLFCVESEKSDHSGIYAEYAVFLTNKSAAPHEFALDLVRPHFVKKCHCGSLIDYDHPVSRENRGNAVRLLTSCSSGRHQHMRWVIVFLDEPPEIPNQLPEEILKIKVGV